MATGTTTTGYLDINEAADYIKYKKSSIYTYISKRQIPCIKCGGKPLFRVKDLDKWVINGGPKGYNPKDYLSSKF